jgi:hypothetical protein
MKPIMEGAKDFIISCRGGWWAVVLIFLIMVLSSVEVEYNACHVAFLAFSNLECFLQKRD